MGCGCGNDCRPQRFRCKCERDCWLGLPGSYGACIAACSAGAPESFSVDILTTTAGAFTRVTTDGAHFLEEGMIITIAGVTGATQLYGDGDFNGEMLVHTVSSPAEFYVQVTTVADGSGGTVSRQVYTPACTFPEFDGLPSENIDTCMPHPEGFDDCRLDCDDALADAMALCTDPDEETTCECWNAAKQANYPCYADCASTALPGFKSCVEAKLLAAKTCCDVSFGNCLYDVEYQFVQDAWPSEEDHFTCASSTAAAHTYHQWIEADGEIGAHCKDSGLTTAGVLGLCRPATRVAEAEFLRDKAIAYAQCEADELRRVDWAEMKYAACLGYNTSLNHPGPVVGTDYHVCTRTKEIDFAIAKHACEQTYEECKVATCGNDPECIAETCLPAVITCRRNAFMALRTGLFECCTHNWRDVENRHVYGICYQGCETTYIESVWTCEDSLRTCGGPDTPGCTDTFNGCVADAEEAFFGDGTPGVGCIKASCGSLKDDCPHCWGLVSPNLPLADEGYYYGAEPPPP